MAATGFRVDVADQTRRKGKSGAKETRQKTGVVCRSGGEEKKKKKQRGRRRRACWSSMLAAPCVTYPLTAYVRVGLFEL